MPSSRNDPCPCGSGKKFKQCCGAIKPAAAKNKVRENKDLSSDWQRAVQFHQSGQPQQAESLYFKLLKSQPGHPQLLELLGVVSCQQDKFTEGASYFKRAIAVNSKNPDLYYNLAKALKALGHTKEAADCYSAVLRLQPHSADALYNLANLFKERNQFDQAVGYYRKAVDVAPKHADAYNNLGIALKEQGKLDEAITCHLQTLTLNPGHAESYNNLGVIYGMQGKLHEAVAAYKKALELKPDYPDAYGNLMQCEQAVTRDSAITSMEAKLHKEGLKQSEQITLHFALGKAYDDSGRYDEAFLQYARGNQLHRTDLATRKITFAAAAFTKDIDDLIATFSGNLFAGKMGSGCDSELPVFVVGMARSGTTLVEQIIATHPQGYGAGESELINETVRTLTRQNPEAPYPHCIPLLGQSKLAELADTYLQNIQLSAGQAKRIVDKMPDNILELGLIALLFPKAHVVYCQRDPRDICLSCFFQKFSNGLPFSTDLVDCGKRYIQIQRLLEHWKRVLPIRILELHYEKLVTDQEIETRRLLEFLGLEWEPQCLEFHKTERIVKTASVWQVRQPLYNSSVGRWRHYEKHLHLLLDVL